MVFIKLVNSTHIFIVSDSARRIENMPEQGTTPTRKKSSLLKNLASDSLFAVEPPCDAPRTLVKPTTVNAVGYAKGTQYLATGRDIPGVSTCQPL